MAGAGKAGFVQAFLDGKIEAIGLNGDSPLDIVFSLNDVAMHFDAARLAAAKGWVNAGQAASLIGCNSDALHPLACEGHLVERKGLHRLSFCELSVKRFSAQYVPLGILSTQLKTSAKSLVSLCLEAEVHLLRVARRPNQMVSFADRSDIVKISEILSQRRANQLRSRPPSCVSLIEKYLQNLARNGESVPSYGTRINMSKVARASGLCRVTLSYNKAAVDMIEAFRATQRTDATEDTVPVSLPPVQI